MVTMPLVVQPAAPVCMVCMVCTVGGRSMVAPPCMPVPRVLSTLRARPVSSCWGGASRDLGGGGCWGGGGGGGAEALGDAWVDDCELAGVDGDG